jgi:hypothetical protein
MTCLVIGSNRGPPARSFGSGFDVTHEFCLADS